ncbi:MAG: energy-converting hydrogenase subunit [Archaeoglobi archaeon]|nr:energy-converting hydrogenase subunit [Archaeoglobi archaeon]MDK2781844.1 energy-converting hydrogenase subunit [Archaeoglobi archaeon]
MGECPIAELEFMKRRILMSYRYQEDVVKPIAKFLGISPEELTEILIRRLDMAGLEALHPRMMQANRECLEKRIELELNLCTLSDFLSLLSFEEKEKIREEIGRMIDEGRSYEEIIEEGKKMILKILRGER